MGDSENIAVDGVRKSKLIAVITLLLGLFAPFLLTVSDYGFDSQIMLMTLQWSLFYSPSVFPNSPPSYRFELLPPEVIIQLFPFVLLRLVPVSQIYRYYQGKTTRGRALIASIFGDGIYIFYFLFVLINPFRFGLFTLIYPIPLSFQFLFCVVVLWRYPIPKPTTPWDGMKESEAWLEEDLEPKEEELRNEDTSYR